MTEARWTEIAHTADVGIRVVAPDRQALFETAARGLLAMIGDFVPGEGGAGSIDLCLSAADDGLLLRDWLAEILYLVEQRRCTVTAIRFARLTDTALEATLDIAPYDMHRSTFCREVKAVTYHHLSVEHAPDGFTASVLFDI